MLDKTSYLVITWNVSNHFCIKIRYFAHVTGIVFSTYTIWTAVYVIWLLDIWGKMFTRAGSPLSRDTSGYMKVQRLNMFQSNGFYFYLHTCVVLCWCSINPNIQIASSNSLPFTVLSLFICFKALLVIIVIYHKILTFCFLLCKEKVVYVSVAD